MDIIDDVTRRENKIICYYACGSICLFFLYV